MPLLSQPQDCCRPCPEPVVQNIPGAQGAAGADGTNGTDGVSAWTTVTSPFAMPAEGADVTVEVGNGSWAAIGENVFLGDPAAAAKGTFQVMGKPDDTHLTLRNIADVAAGEYVNNSVAGTVFPVATVVSPSGLQGPEGPAAASGAPDDAKYLIQTPDADLPNAQAMSALATGLVKNTTATGVQSVVPIGIAASNIAPVDAGAALTAGQMVGAVAGGFDTPSDAVARGRLGLGTMATQDANNVNITGGTISGIVLAPPAGLIGAWLVFQNQQASGTPGGSFANGSWVLVPLNTEVVDTGNYGSISAGVITLAAGTYRARWRVPAFQVANFQSRLLNFDLGTVIGYGSNSSSAAAESATTESCGEARFTLGVATQVQLEARCQTTNAGDGFGVANSFGAIEVYQAIEFEKETA